MDNKALDLGKYVLGENNEHLVCFDADENCRTTAHMVRQAVRHVDILSRDLSPEIYDNEECFEAFEELALRSRHSRIRILLHDPYTLSRRGHCLLRLGMRLSTYFEFRRLAEVDQGRSETFLIADDIGVMHRPHGDSLKTHTNFCDPLGAKELSTLFSELWERGEDDPNLRFTLI